MVADDKNPPGTKARLDVEFVPMPVAAATAYYGITGERKVACSAAELAEINRLVAMALSTVAPIYRMTQGAARPSSLSAAEVNKLLFQTRSPDLSDVAIRRDDLQGAIAALRRARTSLG